jgi:hypothetical protein
MVGLGSAASEDVGLAAGLDDAAGLGDAARLGDAAWLDPDDGLGDALVDGPALHAASKVIPVMTPASRSPRPAMVRMDVVVMMCPPR